MGSMAAIPVREVSWVIVARHVEDCVRIAELTSVLEMTVDVFQ